MTVFPFDNLDDNLTSLCNNKFKLLENNDGENGVNWQMAKSCNDYWQMSKNVLLTNDKWPNILLTTDRLRLRGRHLFIYLTMEEV